MAMSRDSRGRPLYPAAQNGVNDRHAQKPVWHDLTPTSVHARDPHHLAGADTPNLYTPGKRGPASSGHRDLRKWEERTAVDWRHLVPILDGDGRPDRL